ncbi:hypothetical protein SLEP1_g55342 [Rubroshorea leprosula]|nr:hypothetical protein SLEP1_g55342 [Rubroshorea leprosula]
MVLQSVSANEQKGAFIPYEAPDLNPNIVTSSAVVSTFAL